MDKFLYILMVVYSLLGWSHKFLMYKVNMIINVSRSSIMRNTNQKFTLNMLQFKIVPLGEIAMHITMIKIQVS